MADKYTTQVPLEILTTGDPEVRTTQDVVEVLSSHDRGIRVTGVPIEVLYEVCVTEFNSRLILR